MRTPEETLEILDVHQLPPAVLSGEPLQLGGGSRSKSLKNESHGKSKTHAAAPKFTPTPFVWRDPATIPRRQFLYGRHYIRGFVSATVAPGGVGKSSLALVEAVAMASGRGLLGIHLRRALKVWYINLEDPREEIERRVAAICLHFGVKPCEIEGRLFFDGREIEIILASQTKNGVAIATPVVDALIAAMKDGGVDVLTLDPFVSAHRVTENDNMAIDAVAKSFGRIASAAKCAIELIHHVRKTGGAEITAEDGRGASALVAAARSIHVLNPMSKDEGDKAGLDEDRRLYFRADIGKANLAPPSAKATWFRLASVPLGNGSGGPIDDQDYVGVASPWQWPNAFEGVTVADLRAVQSAIAAGRWRESPQAKEWAGYAVAKVLKLDPTNKAARAKIGQLLKTWIDNGMFVVVEREDERRKKKWFVEVGEPAND